MNVNFFRNILSSKWCKSYSCNNTTNKPCS